MTHSAAHTSPSFSLPLHLTFPAKAMSKYHNKINKEILKQKLYADDQARTTISFYQYAQILNLKLFRDHLYILLDNIGVLGRIYVANEGINAQLSVPQKNEEKLKDVLDTILFLKDVRLNKAIEDDGKSFFKLTIKIRNKIVADGLDDASFDASKTGVHLNAEAFNAITQQGETVIVDMRNHYESEVGHFKEAIRPDVETFRESLPIVEDILEKHREKNIVMYCTGGIRCEKASAYFKHKGFDKVFQLEGGIIEYTRQVKKLGIENKFVGKNFVFDERLGERITEDIISNCHQCGTLNDEHTNCMNEACHILFIQCPTCKEKYQGCCSQKCNDFIKLDKEEQDRLKVQLEFNGSKFGKGRYKASRKGEDLGA